MSPPVAQFARAARPLLVVALPCVVLLFLAVGERALYSGKVMPGVRVDGVDVAGERELRAYDELVGLQLRLEHTPIRVRVRGEELSIDPSLLAFSLDPYATVRAARRAARSANPVDQVIGMIERRVRDDVVPLVVHYDERRLEGVLDGWSAATNRGVVEGGLRLDGTTVVPIEPHVGTGIRRGEARHQLQQVLGSAARPVVTLPVGRVGPRLTRAAVERAAARARDLLTGEHTLVADTTTLTITNTQLVQAMGTRIVGRRLDVTLDGDRLRVALGPALAALETPPVDATFAVTAANAVQIVPSRVGHQIDMAAVTSAISRGDRRIVAPARDVVPVHDTKWAEGLGITKQVSTFTTYHAAGQPRVHNIHLAADILDNAVVEPGQLFSLNDRIGPRTPDRGFVKAPVLGDREYVEDYGGGVSQLTTTLYNAVFFGGYKDVEHAPHSIYISRYPKGREATINYGSLDLKFRNDTSHGVLIRTSYTATSITVTFYGDNDGRSVREDGPFVLGQEPVEDETIPCPAPPEVDKNNDCARLTFAQTKRIQEGVAGLDVELYRVIDQPGRPEVRQHYFWHYAMLPNRILVGTALPSTTAPPSTVASATTATSHP